MNIVYAMTRNFYHKILPSLRSLAEWHPDADVYVLAEDIILPFETPIPCHVIDVSDTRIFNNSVNINNRFGGYINLLKVLYPVLLPKLDKVIHLNLDTIICDSLDDFWNIDIDGKWFASVPEYLAKHGREKMFGDVYYNMGVSLINLEQMRKDNICMTMVKYLNEVEQPFADQDAWNKYGIEQDKAVAVPLRFNENMSTGYTDNPAIVHYCGISDWYENKTIKRREYIDKYLPHKLAYMIHTCNDREWYVKDYLIPSLIDAGIAEENIIVWHDYDGIGNLASFTASCRWIRDNLNSYDDTWHLQDDVVISPDFFAETQKRYSGIANGFCNEIFDAERTNYIGNITVNGMWFSFQCIMIPNRLATAFAEWFDSGESERLFPEYVSSEKCDDSLFREYAMKYHPNLPATNIFPNIVDHIDYLIGGTTINQQRVGKYRKSYWRDQEGRLDKAVSELEHKLKGAQVEMREIFVTGNTLPSAYHNALMKLNIFGEESDCADWKCKQLELSMTIHVTEPLREPMISKCFIGGARELEQYRMEMLDGILDFEVEKGKWSYTYHQRMGKQIQFVIDELRRNPSSRRAVMCIRTPDDMGSDDPACLQLLQYFIRDGKLDCMVLFRSNDACKATFMNAFALIMLQKRIATELGVPVGTYTHRANSFHCYQKDYDMLNAYVQRISISSEKDLTYRYVGDWHELMEDERDDILAMVEELKSHG